MDNYNVLVLMQKDPVTNEILDTVLSVQMNEGLENVTKAYVCEESDGFFTYLFLTTADVEDWEYYGIYEEYDEELFDSLGGSLEEAEDFNPAWRLRLPYGKDDLLNEELIRKAVKMHYEELLRVRASIPAKKEAYEKMAEEEE